MKLSFLTPPESLSLPTFGLDISRSSVKLSKLENKEVGSVPEIVDEVKLSETCQFFSKEENANECKEVKGALTNLKKKYKIDFVRVSIPEENTYVFRTLVPQDVLHTIEEFIMYNLDQYIPLDPQEVIFDYKILADHVDEGKIPVIVTAIPKKVIGDFTSIIESCGITIVAFEPETHAIARAVIDKEDLNPYIIINVDHHSTSISVVEDRFVQYTQTLPIKGDDIAKKMSPGTANVFKDSINKVIIYWFTSKDQVHKSQKIENIILTGEALESPNLINFLESNLFVNATFGNVWSNCFDLNDYVPKISKMESLKYATCIGLCLSKIK
jgi:Tfp pilus assembly PilM family ATPase